MKLNINGPPVTQSGYLWHPCFLVSILKGNTGISSLHPPRDDQQCNKTIDSF